MPQVTTWIKGFLSGKGRELTEPDGRPLFAYHSSLGEFEELGAMLSKCMDSRYTQPLFSLGTGNAFVLYGAEWWRRHYAGGPWKWELIIDSLGWQNVEQKHLAVLAVEGLTYWCRDVVRTAVGNAYLTTIVLEGGIPLLLLQQQGASFTRYLKAVIGEHAKWVGAGMSAYAHAISCQRVLTAKSLRREQVFRLAATIVEVVYELSRDLESRTHPFEELSRRHPDWQKRLPMAVEDESARVLIDALLKEAQRKRSSRYEKFVINRYLTLADGVWVQRARLEMPDTIPVEVIAEQLSMKSDNLPSRMEVVARTSRFTMKVASLMRIQRELDEYVVSFYRSNNMMVDVSFNENIRCSLQAAGQSLGDYRADGADQVDIDLPLVFVADDALDWRLVGAGSLSTRVGKVRLLVPQSSEIEGDASRIEDGNSYRGEVISSKLVYDVAGDVIVQLEDGFTCKIRIGADRESNTFYSLSGNRVAALEQSGTPVYTGMPALTVPAGAARPDIILWRAEIAGSVWVDVKEREPRGLVRIRALAGRECLFAARAIVLPAKFRFYMDSSEGIDKGTILVRGLEDAVVSCDDPKEIETELETIGNVTAIYCHSQRAAGGKFPVSLRWLGGAQCTLAMPFPGEGARFIHVRTGVACRAPVSISELVNISAQIVSRQPKQGFKIIAQLRAKDIDASLSRSMCFERAVSHFVDSIAELSLVDLYSPLKELFSYSADLDATIRIELIAQGAQRAKLDVVQFDGELSFDPVTRVLSYKSDFGMPVDNPVVKYLPFDVEQDEVEFERLGEPDAYTWKITRFEYPPAGLAVVEGQLGRLIRPCAVYTLDQPVDYVTPTQIDENEEVASEVSEAPLIPLAYVWKLDVQARRRRAYEAAFEMLANNPCSEDWEFLVQFVQRYHDTHPDCLDSHEALIDSPGALVGLICRAQPEIADLLAEWSEYLPVRLWMVPLNIWRAAIRAYLGFLDQFGETVVSLEKEKLTGIFKKLRDLQPNTILVMNQLLTELDDPQELTEFELSFINIKENVSRRRDAIQQEVATMLFGRPDDERWPPGLDREAWKQISKNPLWLDPGIGFRRAFIDSPVFAAFCVAKGIYLERKHRAHIAALRNFDSQAFDKIYLSFLVVFLKFVK